MTRYVLVRTNGQDVVVPEASIPKERELHDALINHPQLLPVEDFGFRRSAVVGREASLEAGAADLVLVDEDGQLALVEVKKEGNADTRRVVAQLLDYAGAVWSLSLEEFEVRVLGRYLKTQGKPPKSLTAFFQESFPSADLDDGDPDAVPAGSDPTTRFLEGLTQRLESGRFVLVVAAPQIPPGVRRALEYLNEQGLRLFGIEFSYFKQGDTEIYSPRLVVRPTTAAARKASPSLTWDMETFLEQMPAEARDFLRSMLEGAQERGAELRPNPAGGGSIVLRLGGAKKSLMTMDWQKCWLSPVPTSGPFPPGPFQELRNRIASVTPSFLSPNGWFATAHLRSLTPAQAEDVAAAFWDACDQILGGDATVSSVSAGSGEGGD